MRSGIQTSWRRKKEETESKVSGRIRRSELLTGEKQMTPFVLGLLPVISIGVLEKHRFDFIPREVDHIYSR